MDNKSNNYDSQNNFKNFFKKESFYVILFVCLCIAAAVAAISINSKKVAKKSTNNIVSKEIQKQEPDNALLVEREKEQRDVAKNKKNEIKVYKSGKKLNSNNATASVSNNVLTKFNRPVEGKIIEGYSEIPVLAKEFSDENTKTYKTNLGINIETKLGTSVKAVADGVIELIGNNPKGYGHMIVVDHKNGFKTVYSNLDGNVLVKQGEKVNKGQELGKVGNTTLRTSTSENNKQISHLHFSILQGSGNFKDLDYGNKYIDPAKFIK